MFVLWVNNLKKPNRKVTFLVLPGGVDWVGLAAVDGFNRAPQNHKPADLLPSANIKMPRNLLQCFSEQ